MKYHYVWTLSFEICLINVTALHFAVVIIHINVRYYRGDCNVWIAGARYMYDEKKSSIRS